MDERKDHLWKVAQEAEERIDDLVKAGANPVGVDVGTSKTCCLIGRRTVADAEVRRSAGRT